MKRQQLHWFASLLGAVLFAALLGCNGNVIGPANQLEVQNMPDDFQWQVTALNNVSQTLRYTWENTGAEANINQAGSVTGGTARVIIRDAAGTQVYERNLNDNGTFQSTAGAAGSWTIEVRLSGVDGTLNFRVQKRP